MIRILETQAIPNQRFNVVLGEQNCTIHLYQRGEYMYMDFACNGEMLRQGAICLVNIDVLQYPTPFFEGMLFFTDTTDHDGIPVFTELGTRYLLCYDDGADE